MRKVLQQGNYGIGQVIGQCPTNDSLVVFLLADTYSMNTDYNIRYI